MIELKSKERFADSVPTNLLPRAHAQGVKQSVCLSVIVVVVVRQITI